MLILVNYPDLLEIAHLSEYIRKIELKKIYDRDIENNSNLFFQHKKVFPIKEDGDIENKTKFHHLITEELYEKDDNGKKISSHRCNLPYN